MIAKVYSAIPDGYNGQIIEIEGDTSKSLPSFNIVGMANKTVSEARERVRSAITNSDLIFPAKKVTVNLAPAEVAKTGSHLDLPIALNVLILSKQLLQSDLQDKLFVGELSMDGIIKPIHGIVQIAEAAKQAGFSEIYLPAANLTQASLIHGIKIIPVKTLKALQLHLRGIQPFKPVVKITQTDTKQNSAPPNPRSSNASADPDAPSFSDIIGQDFAKRALLIALAGHHNILLSGPPGAGKTLLARAARNLLPPLNNSEQISLTKLQSLYSRSTGIVQERPFRSPHHTSSPISIIGGGAHASPGEISLAHQGILFLDELPEFPRSVLESLRQPLEDHVISIARANQHVTYPANFMLIATMNPCPCGYLGDKSHTCTCTQNQIKAYQDRISGPIYDRIDLCLRVQKVSNFHFPSSPKTVVKNTDTEVKQTISACLKRQFQRYHSPALYNSSLSPRQIQTYLTISPPASQLLAKAADKLNLSARAYYKVIKISATIADLAMSDLILPEHISEALAFRQQPK